MNVVLPMAMMVLFGALCVGTFVWMRRPDFGESEKHANKIGMRSNKDLSTPLVDDRGVARAVPSLVDESTPAQSEVNVLRMGRS